MILLAQLRIWAHNWQITSIHREDDFAVFRYSNRKRIEILKIKSGERLRIVDNESAYLPLGKQVKSADQLTEVIKSLLRP
jgi:hypothetical protein